MESELCFPVWFKALNCSFWTETSHLTCLRRLEHLTVEVKTFWYLECRPLVSNGLRTQVAASDDRSTYSFKPWEDLSLVFVELMLVIQLLSLLFIIYNLPTRLRALTGVSYSLYPLQTISK